jgi:hypothetical protein
MLDNLASSRDANQGPFHKITATLFGKIHVKFTVTDLGDIYWNDSGWLKKYQYKQFTPHINRRTVCVAK